MAETKTIDKALTVLKHLLSARKQDVNALSQALDIPQATLYRHMAALERHGLVQRQGKSDFTPGLFLLQKFDQQKFHQLLRDKALSIIDGVTQTLELTAHLGVFEQDMVMYLIKSGPEKSDFFTREAAQLDAYCSAIGKILLGTLTADELDSYFEAGELPALTRKTMTDESLLRKEIAATKKRGYGVDNEEFEEGLFCIAVPLFDRDRNVLAAISISSHSPSHLSADKKKIIQILKGVSNDITNLLYS